MARCRAKRTFFRKPVKIGGDIAVLSSAARQLLKQRDVDDLIEVAKSLAS